MFLKSIGSVTLTRPFLLTTMLLIITALGLGKIIMADTPLQDVETVLKDVDTAAKKADEAVTSTVTLKTALDAVTSTKAEEATLNSWEQLATKLKDSSDEILKKLNDSATDLPKQEKKITDLIKKLEDMAKPDETKDSIQKLKEAQEKMVKDRVSKVAKAKSDLKASTDNIYKAADTAAKELSKQLDKLTSYISMPKPEAAFLSKNLQDQLPILIGNIILQNKFDAQWPLLEAELKKLTDTPSTKPAESIAKSFEVTNAVLKKIPDWINTLTEDSDAAQNDLLEMRGNLDKDVQKYAIAGLKLLNQSENKATVFNNTAGKAEEIKEQINKSDKYPAATRDQLSASITVFKNTLEKMPTAISWVREGLAGNYEEFVADFVPLYNFTDVYNLMKILNPEVHEVKDVSALKDEAEAARRKVDKADLDLISARATVSALQTRLRNLQDDLKQANDKLASSTKLLTRQTRVVEELESRPDPDKRKIKEAKQRKEDLERENTANQENANELNDDVKGLPAQIRTAQEQMLAAQKQARDGRSEMVMLTQLESNAFAAARDNEQVFFALNNVTSKDPIKQVMIYAFGSRKVLYIRGKRGDVDKAKDIISLFDRPAPQARITLRTIELSSSPGMEGTRKFTKALDLVENNLASTRSEIAGVLAYLRDCINQEVNAISLKKLADLETARRSSTAGLVRDHNYYVPNAAEDMRWARLFFYQTEVLMRLGFDPEKRNALDSRNQTRAINRLALPDPAGTTTLGESLVVLSLANPASRYEIMEKFSQGISGKLKEMGLSTTDNICPSSTCFSSTKRALGADFEPYYHYQYLDENQLRDGRTNPAAPSSYPATYAFTSMQKEIVGAITKATIPRLISRLIKLQNLLPDVKADAAATEHVEQEIADIRVFLWDALGISAEEFSKKTDEIDFKHLNASLSGQFAEVAKKANILRMANAQVARADLMLKQLIDAVNEDMDRHFIKPMMSHMRQGLLNEKGISVGVINETSVLATNRLVARVDPRSSAQLSIGDTQDALQAAQQLANLYLAAQSNGVLGGLAGLGGVEQKDTSEIYGLTSGSVFKVNPRFDPTGQTLRFQFDYVGASMVTDPDGSINPQLPRIERHTVNTEVELNNFELREISRFDSNARLGIATKYTGGLPIIKDLPYVKYVPLIGWFTRRAGKSAVIQESLMLGQTTMYPTIADIFDLLNGDDYYFYSDLEDCNKNSTPEPQTEATPTASPTPQPQAEATPTASSAPEPPSNCIPTITMTDLFGKEVTGPPPFAAIPSANAVIVSSIGNKNMLQQLFPLIAHNISLNIDPFKPGTQRTAAATFTIPHPDQASDFILIARTRSKQVFIYGQCTSANNATSTPTSTPSNTPTNTPTLTATSTPVAVNPNLFARTPTATATATKQK